MNYATATDTELQEADLGVRKNCNLDALVKVNAETAPALLPQAAPPAEQLASTIIVEENGRDITVALHNPMTVHELWHHFANRGSRPTMIALTPNGTARVSFAPKQLI